MSPPKKEICERPQFIRQPSGLSTKNLGGREEWKDVTEKPAVSNVTNHRPCHLPRVGVIFTLHFVYLVTMMGLAAGYFVVKYATLVGPELAPERGHEKVNRP